MRTFDFAPAGVDAPFRDVGSVLESLERAKTAMRTLGKYAPIELVRELYRDNREPKLGGELTDVTLIFTDIEGFTSLAERITPNELADALGRYFETMTRVIRATGGTVDKFIGDAVMAMWNAPSPLERHAASACHAVLACIDATRALYESRAWSGLPPLVTRFGVHTDRVLVGHFGAPERLSFTALGDGVNLASRLEALGAQYAVTKLVSDAVVQAVGAEFSFRPNRQGGCQRENEARSRLRAPRVGASNRRATAVEAYESALDHYCQRRFGAAKETLAPHLAHDPPSRVLSLRCEAFIERPPADDWDGTFVARAK